MKTSQLKVGAVLSYVSIFFNILAGLIYTPWMIGKIGQSDFGVFTLANSLITLFLIDFGLSSATARFIAKYRAEHDEESMNIFLSAVYKLYIIIDVVVLIAFVVIFLFIDLIYANLTPLEIEKFKIVYCIAATYSLISFPCVTFNGILKAFEVFIPLKTADLIQRVGAVCLTIITLLCGGGLYSIVIVNVIMGLISCVIKFYYVKQNVNIKFVKNTKAQYKEIFAFSIWSTIWGLAERLIFNITPTIIGIVVTSASATIAVFGIVTTIEGYVYMITTAISGMFLSKIMRIIRDDSNGEKLTTLAVNVGKFQFTLNGLIVVGFFLIGKEFILLWMGEDYILAYYGVLLVAIPEVFYNSLQIANTTIVAQNLIKYQAYIHIVIGICNLFLSTLLSHFWGVIGASISICIVFLIRIFLTLVLIGKKLKINLSVYIRECYIQMMFPSIFTSIICYLIFNIFDASTWSMCIVKGAIIVLVYMIFIMIFSFSRNERRIIINKVCKIVRYKKG